MAPGQKIGRALKSAALLPVKGIRASTAKRSATMSMNPQPGEEPMAILRLQIEKCEGLIAKDRGGTSDPFVVCSLLSTRHTTPVSKKTLNPTYAPATATFDFPLYTSLADKLGVLELIVWDKDTFGKDYLGEVGIPLEAWFVDLDEEGRTQRRVLDWESSSNTPFSLSLLSTKSHTVATGTISVKLGFVLAPNSQSSFPEGRAGDIEREAHFANIYKNLVRRSRPSLVSAPPTEGVGTIRSNHQSSNHPLFEDDGGLSSESESESEYSETDSESESESESEYEDALGGGGDGMTRAERIRRRQQIEEEREQEMHERAVNQALGLDVPTSSSTSATTLASSGATTKASSPIPTPMTRSTSGAPSLNTSTTIPPPTLDLGGFKSPTTPTQEATIPTPTLPDAPGSAATITGFRPAASLGEMGAQMKGYPYDAPPSYDDSVSGQVASAPVEKQKEIQGPAAPPQLTPSGDVATPPPVVISPPSASSSPPPPLAAAPVEAPKPSKVQRLSSTFSINKILPRRLSSKTNVTTAGSSSASSSALPTPLEGAGGELGSSPEDSSALSSTKSSKGKFGIRKKERDMSDPASLVDSPSASSGFNSSSAGDEGGEKKRRRKKVGRKIKGVKGDRKSGKEYHLGADNDIVGIVMLEIRSAEDLPKLHNMTRTGWDMDPFVVISFGKKVFRTRVIRHSRNPTWDEKLLFHVRRYEIGFKVHFSILDWDKLSANDHIGDASFDVKDLLDSAPQPDPSTGLYGKEAEEAGEMKDMKMKLSAEKGGQSVKWDAKHSPELSIRAKFQPYAALRQKFWRQYLNQYDTDDTSTLSHLELTSMLDSLGSTLTSETIESFWTRFGKHHEKDELTMEEAIMCLETELGRPVSERKVVKPTPRPPSTVEGNDSFAVDGNVVIGDGSATASAFSTPLVMHGLDARGKEINLEEMDFSGRPRVVREESTDTVDSVPSILKESYGGMPVKGSSKKAGKSKVPPTGNHQTSGNQQPLIDVVNEDVDDEGDEKRKGKRLRFGRKKSKAGKEKKSSKENSDDSSPEPSPSPSTSSNMDDVTASGAPAAPASVERVINVKNCPMCHRPRMKSKAEMDIITHMAICASQDWGSVDKIMVGNFVTAGQAQRKWYTKVLNKVSSGNYKLGANSANIIVQNRGTGQLEEEKMQVYVRLGIRLLYKGATSQMEGTRAKKLLKSLSIKQGVKYDSPASAAEIPGFIAFHNLDLNEILDPLDSFKTFNEFFYRKLKATARPVDSPEDPLRLVSSADCRFMAFETIHAATQIWIKGRDFSVAKLLGPEYKEDWGRYDGGALAIFRLAPQDYHRFHVPVDGTIGKMRYIAGEYYTVNPQAIRTALDVYGENARKIVPIDSPHFGRVMAVCVGAMMVGSIETTVEEGQKVKRGDEFGYFAFGGSTIVILFEPGAVEWDEDLRINGQASLETLVRVNSGLGRGNTEFRSSVSELRA